jgi:GT2 family glycosyltransferase
VAVLADLGIITVMDSLITILVHYNSEKETKTCIESLLKIETPQFKHKVVVIDNASKIPLELPAYMMKAGVEVLRSEANLGFTGGNNLAIRHVIDHYNPDYVNLLNNDTIVDPSFLKHLYKMAKAHPEYGVISPKIYFAKGREFHAESYKTQDKGHVIWYAGGSIDWRNLYAFHRGVDELDRGQFDSQESSEFATGCCMFISRTVLETIGLLDDRYFLYLEDVDFSQRALLQGFKIGFCPQSIVWHINAGSTGGAGSPMHQYYQSRNRLWFIWKYGQWRTKLTAVKLAVNWFLNGNRIERQATMDAFLKRMGKKAVL